MSGGSQPAPDLPCRATRPVGGTSDQGATEIAMVATIGKKNPHDRRAHHHQYHQVRAGSGVTCFGFARSRHTNPTRAAGLRLRSPRRGLRGRRPRFQLTPIHPK